MAEAGIADKKSIKKTLEGVRALIGERLSLARAVRDHHGESLTWHPSAAPDAVAFVQSTAEVSEIIRLCAAHRTPVIPFGAGSSLEGHVCALHGGVCLDMSGMNRILAVNAEDMDCRIEAGVTRKQLDRHLRGSGLFFPVDPGADATLGGMAATRASGTNTLRYGAMRENVLSLTAVMADGRVIRTGQRARKSAAGYDLTRLLVGSEGTLGVITELALRLHGAPEALIAGSCAFPDLAQACQAVIATLQMGIPAARMELCDAPTLRAINVYCQTQLPETPTLFFEFHGAPASVNEQLTLFQDIAADCRGGDFIWAKEQEQRETLWHARHHAFYAITASRPGRQAFVTDVCVPVSRLTDCIAETTRDLEDNGLYGPMVAHAGDGNFHCILFAEPGNADELGAVRRFCERLALRAIAMEGTCTGEHGVGFGKSKFLQAEHGEALSAMRALKRALDPQNILNPGKIFPD